MKGLLASAIVSTFYPLVLNAQSGSEDIPTTVVKIALEANSSDQKHLLRFGTPYYFEVRIPRAAVENSALADSLELRIVRDTSPLMIEADRVLHIQPRIALNIMAMHQRGGHFRIRDKGQRIKCPLKFRLRGPTIRATYQYPLEPGEYQFKILLLQGVSAPLVIHHGTMSAYVK